MLGATVMLSSSMSAPPVVLVTDSVTFTTPTSETPGVPLSVPVELFKANPGGIWPVADQV